MTPRTDCSSASRPTGFSGFLQELPVKCQQVFFLHRLERVPQREVAARLGFSERMVRRYVTYAMVYCHLRLDGLAMHEARQKVSL